MTRIFFIVVLLTINHWGKDESPPQFSSSVQPDDLMHFSEYDASIVFREVQEENLEGILSFFGDEIPGYDHIALQLRDTIYEIHPGYGQGKYLYNAHAKDSVFISFKIGVQWQHNLNSFLYNSREANMSPTISTKEVPINLMEAEKMRDLIKSVRSARYQFVNHSISALTTELMPDQQKGADGSFTCVGLLEWAAEKAGINDGQGYVPNSDESIAIHLSPAIRKIELGVLRPQIFYKHLVSYTLTQ